MTDKQADWIQLWWGKEDHRIYKVVDMIKKTNKLGNVSQDDFQEMYDAWDELWGGGIGDDDDDLLDQVYNKLLGAYKK